MIKHFSCPLLISPFHAMSAVKLLCNPWNNFRKLNYLRRVACLYNHSSGAMRRWIVVNRQVNDGRAYTSWLGLVLLWCCGCQSVRIIRCVCPRETEVVSQSTRGGVGTVVMVMITDDGEKQTGTHPTNNSTCMVVFAIIATE